MITILVCSMVLGSCRLITDQNKTRPEPCFVTLVLLLQQSLFLYMYQGLRIRTSLCNPTCGLLCTLKSRRVNVPAGKHFE
jgi:hypothetical protein